MNQLDKIKKENLGTGKLSIRNSCETMNPSFRNSQIREVLETLDDDTQQNIEQEKLQNESNLTDQSLNKGTQCISIAQRILDKKNDSVKIQPKDLIDS